MSKRKTRARGTSAFSKPKGMFLGGLFSGSGGSTQSQQSTNTNQQNFVDPGGSYYPLTQDVLQRGRDLVNRPYQPYEGQRFEGFNPDQQQAFQGVRNNQGAYQGNFGMAGANFMNASSQAGGVGTAGQQAFDTAAGGPGGLGAANPYLSTASGSWTDPGTSQAWMNPYNEAVTDRIAQLGQRNLSENLLPAVNDVFTGGSTASQFGRERHADITGRALRDTNESILGQQAQVLQQGYGQAQNAFNTEQSRMGALGATAGTLGIGDTNSMTNLGTAQTGAAAQGISSQLGAGAAQQGLGLARQGAGYTDAAALGQSGQTQQAFGQQQRDFDYAQNREAFNWPYTSAAQGQSLAQGWQLPTQSNSQSMTYGTQTQQAPSGSVAGGILGAALGIGSLAIPGGGSLGGSFLSGLFKAEGGSVPAFGPGGQVPVTAGVRKRTQQRGPAMAMRAQRMQGMGQVPGMMPSPQPAFAEGGDVGQDRRMIRRAINQHDNQLHGGKHTVLRFAEGGDVDQALLDELGYNGQFLRARPTGRNTNAPAWDQGSLPDSPDPPSWVERVGRRAWDETRDFARALPGAIYDTAYDMLPTVAYSNAVDAARSGLQAFDKGDYGSAGWDALDFALNTAGAMPMLPGAPGGLRAAFSRGRR
jgi:hypothetical protein